MQQQKQVTREEFFAAIGPQNVHPCPVGPYPYTSVFKTPAGHERGRIVETMQEGKAHPSAAYFLPA